MKATLLALLNDLRAAGRHASRAEVSAVLDTHFPTIVHAADPYVGAAMSLGARERGLAALLDATVAKDREIIAPSLPEFRTRRTGWTLAAAAIALVLTLSALWFLRWNNPNDRIAVPSPPPKVTKPDKPQPKGPDLDREDNPIVENKPDGPRSIRPHVPPPKSFLPNLPTIVAEKQPVIGKFGRVQGEPKLLAFGSTTSVKGLPHQEISAGTKIETGDGDKAEILLADGSIMRLSFNTTVVSLEGATREFELLSGTVFAEVASTSDKNPFIIKTAAASARVLGTSFGLAIEKSGPLAARTVLQVTEGRVEFFNDIDSVIATDMMMSTATVGSAPTEPRRLNLLRLYGFTGTGQMLERRTFPLDEEGAAPYYIYPLGSTGFMAGTVPNGELRIITLQQHASARKAGLRVGDAILEIDGRHPSMDSLRRDMYQRAGDTVVFRIRRDGEEFDLKVPVAQERQIRDLPLTIAGPLFAATRPALEGNTELSLERLASLLQRVPHAATFNNLGVVYERLDQMGPALRNYQNAVELDASNPHYRRALARVLLHIGNFRRSVEELEYALTLNRSELETVLVLSDAYQVVNRMDDALKLMEGSEAEFSASVEFWIAKASVLTRANRLPEAIKAAKVACRLAPDNASAQFRLGLALTFSNLFEEAETAFAKAIELDPCLATYYNSRAINLTQMGRVEEAETEYRKGVTLDPEFVPARIGLGGILAGSGRNEEAEELLRETIELDPRNPAAHYNLALALKGQGRLADAEEMLRKTIGLGFVHIDYHWEHAIVLGMMGEFQKSIEAYERAVAVDPQNPHVRSSLGWAQIEIHRWADAVKSLRIALELDPKGSTGIGARMNLGFALIHLGNLDEAETVLGEALKLGPDNLEASMNWALLLAHRGTNLDEALERATKGPIPDAHPHLFYSIGYVHFRRAEYEQAEIALTRAVNDYGKVYLAADALVLLGQVYEAKKDTTAAIDAYKRALQIEPGNRTAADAIKRIGGDSPVMRGGFACGSTLEYV